MKKITFITSCFFTISTMFFITNAKADTTLMCPTKVSLDNIKALKTAGKVSLPTAIQEGGTFATKQMDFTAGKGVDEIHTKLPISSAKFEASKVLAEAKQEGDSLVCRYKFDKTFGRTGEFELKTKK
ncbi:MAG: hypothetical protein Q8S31_08465 [Alphaproteobacteria bacterium]|nr:hypothetical protein [Alphaproteobacteria bacterium]